MREIKFEYIFTCDGRDGIKDERHVFTLDEIRNGAVDGFLDVEYTITARVLAIREFTGLKDKNSKEIYEGDVVRHVPSAFNAEEAVGEVYFDSGWCRFGLKNAKASTHYFDSLNTYEIIGNIYENPELISSNK